MKHIPVQSSNIVSVGYDEVKKDLEVRFTSGGTYVYHTVEESVYAALMAAESKGRYFHAHIKGWYPTDRS